MSQLSWLLAGLAPGVALVAYGQGRARLAARGIDWPPRRVLAMVGGCLCVAGALSPPVVAAAHSFPGHVLQHLVLAMVAPLLLARAAPVTLALRTLAPRSRRLLLRALHSRWSVLVTRPAVVAVVQVVPLYLLYLTPLYPALHGRPWLHVLVHGHMVASGCLMSWVLVGADPMPRRSSLPARLVLLGTVGAAHDVLAKLVYADPGRLGGDPAGVRLGAQWLAYGSAAVEVALAVVLMAGWYQAGGRRLEHEQRRAAAQVDRVRGLPSAPRSRGWVSRP